MSLVKTIIIIVVLIFAFQYFLPSEYESIKNDILGRVNPSEPTTNYNPITTTIAGPTSVDVTSCTPAQESCDNIDNNCTECHNPHMPWEIAE